MIKNPRDLNNIIINQIGRGYLEKYKSPGFFNRYHNRHDIATTLANYKEESSTQEKWLFLIDIYGSILQESVLKESIYACLKSVGFGVERKYCHAEGITLDVPQKDIVANMKAKVNAAFKDIENEVSPYACNVELAELKPSVA